MPDYDKLSFKRFTTQSIVSRCRTQSQLLVIPFSILTFSLTPYGIQIATFDTLQMSSLKKLIVRCCDSFLERIFRRNGNPCTLNPFSVLNCLYKRLAWHRDLTTYHRASTMLYSPVLIALNSRYWS